MIAQEPPAELSDAEKAVWWETLGHLRALGTLGHVSAEELAAYCRAWTAYRRAEEFLQAHGRTLVQRDKSGQVVLALVRPQYRTSRRCFAEASAFHSRVGMTPASRLRLGIVWTERGWRKVRH